VAGVVEQVTILNVDDYEPGRYSRSHLLRRAGFLVLEAATGGEALRLVRSEHPHLVLLDVNLPDMTGFEVCREIKNDPDLAGTLVLHLSATSVTVQSKLQGLKAGGDSYLAEPVDPEELIANVQALIRLKRAEEEVRRTNATLRALIDSSPLAVITIDMEGNVLSWSAAAERIFGWTAEQVIGRALQTVTADRHGEFSCVLARAMAGEVVGSFEACGVRQDGTLIDASISLAPLRGTAGRTDGIVVLVEDISRRKQSERDIARLYEEAAAANRAKDEFLATLSHELRTPLNAMLGWAQMLRRGEVTPARMPHALAVLERNAVAQARLIEDILDISRIVSGKLHFRSEVVDLAVVIAAPAEGIRPQAEASGLTLRVDIGPGDRPLTTIGDPGRLQQVIMNLLSNALKFTPSGGRIEVTLRAAADDAVIEVRDTGTGIDPEFLPLVFERFRQSDSTITRRHGGLGLGLAIARHIVEAHGGTIQVASQPDGGSTFTVRLPLLKAQPAATPHQEERGGTGESLGPLNPPGGRMLEAVRVLVVEDEADSRSLLEAFLGGRGARVVAAVSSAEALRLLDTEGLDVIVADIGLPQVDGYGFLQRVREQPRYAGLPAIALTGFAGETDRIRAAAAGYDAHLSKPFDSDTLVQTIRRLVRR